MNLENLEKKAENGQLKHLMESSLIEVNLSKITHKRENWHDKAPKEQSEI